VSHRRCDAIAIVRGVGACFVGLLLFVGVIGDCLEVLLLWVLGIGDWLCLYI